MREIGVSSTLTVYHDGQFWVGMFERIEEGRLSACRVVFGAEPPAEEIQRLVCERWAELRFTESIEHDQAPRVASNPKRRQREAARELERHGPSTKAQQALSEAREAAAQMHKADSHERREREQRERFEKRQERRRKKRRGR